MGDLRPLKGAPNLFRVYLDNFDELRKLERRAYELVKGTPSSTVISLREAYLLS